MSALKHNGWSRFLGIFVLVFAGEIIFSLPFHVARFFRPTLLEVFGLSNAELGDVFAVYGVTAMLAYFPGGVIADHISARKLMAVSLLATAFGGLYMASVPGWVGMSFLFAYWGVTSILLFWSALLRATREWGGILSQGRAFGILDGGRGLLAACVASLAVWILGGALPDRIEEATNLQRQHALQSVIYFYTFLTALAAVFVWFFIVDNNHQSKKAGTRVFVGIKQVVGQAVIWWQALIVVCAYCGFKGLDHYALYAVDVLGVNEVEAARFMSMTAYLRPLAAVVAGIIADRFVASRVVGVAFLLLAVSYLVLSLFSGSLSINTIIFVNLILTFVAVFALRGIYFALIAESGVSRNLTGTAVGLVSVIGFTPDIFFASIAGRLLDASPGLEGYQHFFQFLLVFAMLGLLAALMVRRYEKLS